MTEETKVLIGRLRTAAERLKSDTTLYTVADLLDEAADQLEKYDEMIAKNILC